MSTLYFPGAVLLICIAHLFRVFRWELFIGVYESPVRSNLIRAMSVGYLLNCVLPLKMGELARAWISGKHLKNGKSLGFSTVVVERYLDVVFVGGIFVILSVTGIGASETANTARMYALSAALLLAVGILIYLARSTVKRIIRLCAGIFNDRIQTSVLVFAWALIWNFKDIFQKISKWKMVLLSAAMWGCYLSSYGLFARFLGFVGVETTWAGVFSMLFSQNGIRGSVGSMIIQSFSGSGYQLYTLAYLVLPLLILLGLSWLPVWKEATENTSENYLRLLPQMDLQERLAFLERYFSDSDRAYLQNYLKINQDVSIIRDYSAGSNATTMLCMDGHSTFFRKYAFGADGEKLYQQVCWIRENRGKLPLPEILRYEKTDVYCFYDMPFNSNCVGLFEYAHCTSIPQAWNIIQAALGSLERSVYQADVRKADPQTIVKYVEQKVTKNLSKIKSARIFRDILRYDTLWINGAEYRNLSCFEDALCEEHLCSIFQNDLYSVIHGDLTIENIICTRDRTGQDDFYLIDPNTGNIHDSPNLDYAKLLQSIHGGYEFLMSTKNVEVSENQIRFPFTRSAVYTELHSLLREHMYRTLGPEQTRSIYYHEIIHWLRLMPYKIEKDGKRAFLFYAGMLMVMNDVMALFPPEKGALKNGKETAGAL